ncbi:Leishmanolysin-like peptidase [Schistosoma japonicum]|nr:Leishmanolysin-like peptidase [Schistosoma japonicum]
MNLLLIVLYLSIFNEKLTECFKIKYPARGTKYNKRNMQRGSEFIVGEKFRIQVVMSESIKSLTLFSKFKGVLKKAVKFWTKVMHPKIQSKQQILIERDCSLRVRSKTLPQFHYCPGGCHSTKKCLEFQIPEKYLKDCRLSENDMNKIEVTKPADADFVLFVGLNSTICSDKTLALASICQQDSDTDRPVSATISICSAINYLEDNPNKVKQIITHELAHCFVSEPDNYHVSY